MAFRIPPLIGLRGEVTMFGRAGDVNFPSGGIFLPNGLGIYFRAAAFCKGGTELKMSIDAALKYVHPPDSQAGANLFTYICR